MPKLPVVKPRELLQILQRAGFYIHHQTGSHARLFHRSGDGRRVTVPIHPGDVPQFVLRHIVRQAGMTVEEFIALAQ